MASTALQKTPRQRGDRKPNFIPTKADKLRVEELVLLGLGEATIARCIREEGICVATLRHHFAEVLDTHKNILLSKIAGSAYRWALDESDGGAKGIPPQIRASMKMFILKTKAGWRENDATVINATNVLIQKRIVGVDENDL